MLRIPRPLSGIVACAFATLLGAYAAEPATPLEEGRRLASQGEWKRALDAFDEAARLEPRNHRAHAGRAAMLARLERHAEALEGMDKAIALSARPDPMLSYNRGLTLAELGRFRDAITAFDLAVAGRPELPMPYADRAAARLSLGDLAAAEGDLEAATKADPGYVWTRYYRAQWLFLKGRMAEAGEEFGEVARREPGFLPAALWREIALALSGGGETARPGATGGSEWPGSLLEFWQGRITEAQLLAEAAKQRPANDDRRLSAAHVVLGLKQLSATQRERAAESFRRALRYEVPRHFEQLAAAQLLQTLPAG